MKRSGPPQRKTPMKRTAMRPRRNPMTPDQRFAVLERDRFTCQASAYDWPTQAPCAGGLQVHHRMGRGAGGTSDPHAHDLDRCVTLCLVHHAEVESRRADAYRCGLSLRRNAA